MRCTLINRHHFETIALIVLSVAYILAERTERTISLENEGHNTRGNTELIFFVKKLINSYFSVCSLIFVLDRISEDKHEFTNVSALIMSENKEQSAKYVLNFQNGTLQISNDDRAWTYQKVSSVLRHRSNCMLTITLIKNPSPIFINRVRSLIAPAFLPFSRNDRDHYIFIANPEIHAKLLKMKEVSIKFRYKIVVGVMSDNQRIQISTLDIFGGPLGTPIVVSLSPNSIAVKTDVFQDFIRNLRGHTLQISIPLVISLVEAHLSGDKVNNGKRGRWTYVVREYLMAKFNFTYRMFVSTGGGGTGRLLPNGTWSGVVGDLYYGRADFGVSLTSTDARLLIIGFTDTYCHATCLTFVTGQAIEVYSAMALFWPFNLSVWLGLLGCAIFSMVFFSLAIKFVRFINLETAHATITTQALGLLAPFVDQDIPTEPRSTPLRCFFALWLFFSLIVTTLYRSQLVTLLAFPVLGQLPRTFKELAFSDFQVGFIKSGDAAYNTLSKSQDPVYVTLLQRMEIIKGVNLSCLQKVVTNDKYACIAYDFDMGYLQERNLTNGESRKLQFSGARTYIIYLGLALQANSIYRESFSYAVGQTPPFYLGEIWDRMDIYETVRKPKLKWWAETNQTAEGGETVAESNLTLKNIASVFYVLFYCMCVSTVVLIYENNKSPKSVFRQLLNSTTIKF